MQTSLCCAMQMLFTYSFHAPMCQGLLVFIYHMSYTVAVVRARARAHVTPRTWCIRGQNNLKYIRVAPARVGIVRLWHYFGAGTCSDVGGNQVIACIDRVGGKGSGGEGVEAAARVGAGATEGYPTCRTHRSSSKHRMLFRSQ